MLHEKSSLCLIWHLDVSVCLCKYSDVVNLDFHYASLLFSLSFYTWQIEIKTAPADFRFPTTNQTRHCFTRYVEYHRYNHILSNFYGLPAFCSLTF